MSKPSIRERLDYVEICNVAIEETTRTNPSDTMNIKRYEQLRSLIVKDLTKDPAFAEYSSYLETKNLVLEQESITTNSQQSDLKDIQTGTPEPHEPSSYEEYVEMNGEDASIADYYSRYKNNADYTPAFDPYPDTRYPSNQFVSDSLKRAGRK